jgi:hypothetical protein
VFVDRQRDLVIVHQVRRSLISRNVTPQTITPLLEPRSTPELPH